MASNLEAGSTATYSALTSATTLKATTAGNQGIYQSVRRFSYEPGKSQLIFMSGLVALGAASAATETAFMRMGQFDGSDGAYWEVSSAGGVWTNYLVLRSSTKVLARIPQSAWNLDRLDGSRRPRNRSGFTLDPTKCNIIAISYEWLGVGGRSPDGLTIRTVKLFANGRTSGCAGKRA
jgi:hypothetical protein